MVRISYKYFHAQLLLDSKMIKSTLFPCTVNRTCCTNALGISTLGKGNLPIKWAEIYTPEHLKIGFFFRIYPWFRETFFALAGSNRVFHGEEVASLSHE